MVHGASLPYCVRSNYATMLVVLEGREVSNMRKYLLSILTLLFPTFTLASVTPNFYPANAGPKITIPTSSLDTNIIFASPDNLSANNYLNFSSNSYTDSAILQQKWTNNGIVLAPATRDLITSGYAFQLPDLLKHTFSSGFTVFVKDSQSLLQLVGNQSSITTPATFNVPFSQTSLAINRATPKTALVGFGYKVNSNIEVDVIPVSIALGSSGTMSGDSSTTAVGPLFGFKYNF